MGKIGIGLQMYTIRDETAKDFAGSLRKVAELGYQGVEFAGYGGLSAEELKALLAELGLKSVGSHVALDLMLSDADGQIAYNKTIGSTYIVVPYLQEEYRTPEALPKLNRELKTIAEKCKAQGIGFAYHNHDFEFTTKIGNVPMFDEIFASLPADMLKVELDTCWTHRAGYDPIAYMEKYKDRLPLIHLKDMRKDAAGEFEWTELGNGEVNLSGILAKAEQTGVQWLLVEQDVCKRPSLESIAVSMEWLKKHNSI